MPFLRYHLILIGFIVSTAKTNDADVKLRNSFAVRFRFVQ